MSERRKKGDILAIIASLAIGLLMAAVLIYGSEHKRKKDLVKLHEKAVKEALLELDTKAKKDTDDGQSNSKTQPAGTGGRKAWTPSSDDLNSFGQVIRSMPNDPNTPLLAPDMDDDSTVERKDRQKGSDNSTSSKNSENDDQSDSSNSSTDDKSSNSSSKDSSNTRSTGTSICCSSSTSKNGSNTSKSGSSSITNNSSSTSTNNSSSASNNNSSSTSTNNSSSSKPSPTSSSSTVKTNPSVPPKSENIVPFEPPKPSAEKVKLEEELEAARERIRELAKKEAEWKAKESESKRALSTKFKRRSSSRNIIFDPVPGLFPKIFVNRFFKQRKVQVIVHGPHNSTKEFRFDGGGEDAVNKLLQTAT